MLICRKFLEYLLSHSQAYVERGFDINGALLVENMKELPLISQRIMCDHFSAQLPSW